MNKLLVITGTQRSGTSFMAKFFRNCGFDLGTEFWDTRVNGGFESPDICAHYSDELQDPDFPFTGYWDMVENRERIPLKRIHEKLKVVKFSYLLSNPIFIEEWLTVRKGFGDTFLIMQRPLSDVIKSRRSRPEFDSEDSKYLPRDIEQMTENWHKSLSIIRQHGSEFFFIRFPDSDPNTVVHKISTLIPHQLPSNAVEIYKTLFDPNQVQFK